MIDATHGLAAATHVRSQRLGFFQIASAIPVLFYICYCIYHELWYSLSINVTTGMILAASSYALRVKKKLELACWLLITAEASILVLHSFVDGQMRSPSLWLLPLLPISANYLLNERVARRLCIACALIILAVAVIESHIVLPIQHGAPVFEYLSIRLFGLLLLSAFGLAAAHLSDAQINLLQSEHRKLQESKKNAEKAQASKSSFLATMSHEIRTPMNGILGMTQVLLSRPRPAEQREAIEIIHQSSEGLLLLLNDILDVSKLDVGKLKLQSQPFDLGLSFEKLMGELQGQASVSQIELHYDGLQDSIRVLGDEHRLHQIIRQLVCSALRASEKTEPVRVALSSVLRQGDTGRIVDLELRISGQRTHLTNIENSSLLLSDEMSPNDPTQLQLRSEVLSVSLCKRLVGAMGGRLESIVDKNERAQILLHLSFAWAESESAQRSHLSQAILGDVELCVLVVDDNAINRKVAGLLLTRLGHHCDFAQGGQQAVEAAHKKHYDVIFMDIRMPEIDGFEATRRIRQQEAGPHKTPIVALTANCSPEDRKASQDAGMCAHLGKPLRSEELEQTIARILRDRPPQSATSPRECDRAC